MSDQNKEGQPPSTPEERLVSINSRIEQIKLFQESGEGTSDDERIIEELESKRSSIYQQFPRLAPISERANPGHEMGSGQPRKTLSEMIKNSLSKGKK